MEVSQGKPHRHRGPVCRLVLKAAARSSQRVGKCEMAAYFEKPPDVCLAGVTERVATFLALGTGGEAAVAQWDRPEPSFRGGSWAGACVCLLLVTSYQCV